ncbi:hypothetical protein D9M72_484690 [compost metagenome]
MAVQHGFDLGGPDLVAGGVDHAFEPVAHDEVTVLVDIGQVAGTEEALAVDHHEALFVGARLVPVAQHDLRAMGDDLAGLALRQLLQRDGVDNTGVHAKGAHAQAAGLEPVQRVGQQERRGLGQAIALRVLQAVLLAHQPGRAFRHGRAAAGHQDQAAQVALRQVRLREEVDHHGRRPAKECHPVEFDQLRGGRLVPAGQDDDRAAGVEHAVDAPLQTEQVKERG